jgi:hypothetical protein
MFICICAFIYNLVMKNPIENDLSDIELQKLNIKLTNIDKVVHRYFRMKRKRILRKSISWIVKLR